MPDNVADEQQEQFHQDLVEFSKRSDEREYKSVGYLFTAHGAGLAICLTTLKDYQTTPMLKGIGSFITYFTIGLGLAALAFIFVPMIHLQMVKASRLKRLVNPWVIQLLVLPQILSGLMLLYALLQITRKFGSF